MGLSTIPFGAPSVVNPPTSKYLQNLLGSKKTRCVTNNRDLEAARRTSNSPCIGKCMFDPTKPGKWELFLTKTDSRFPIVIALVTSSTATAITRPHVRIKIVKPERPRDREAPLHCFY
ncbi:hypothetical protein KXD40_007567 [Peronospora effusa]|nr:hypothetical protein KXD40_007567 [Peronospora effusa]